jgi:hypothetical protein
MRTALTAVFATPAILSLSIQHPIADAAQPTSAKLEQAAIEKKTASATETATDAPVDTAPIFTVVNATEDQAARLTAAIDLFSSAGLEMREGTRAAIIAN